MKLSQAFTAAVIAFASACAMAETQNIVRNPSFEEGRDSWTVAGFHSIWMSPSATRMITLCVGANCVNSVGSGAFLRQELVTTPGQLYDLSFWTGTGVGAGEYAVFWNGALLDDQFLARDTIVQHSYSSLLATSGVAMLEIHARNDPSYTWVDDVSVTPHMMSAVPEPHTYAMLLSGLLLSGVALRRRA